MVQEEIYVCNQLYSLPLADLKPDPDQPPSISIRLP